MDALDAPGGVPGAEAAAGLAIGLALQFGDAHLTLAYHAAFPLVLSPDLLYRIRDAFVPATPWTAVADVLLSSLCREVSYELYEMDPAVREFLLGELRADPRLGPARIAALAAFLQEYSRQQLASADPTEARLAQAQHLTAVVYTRPGDAAQELALAFATLDPGDHSEDTRDARLRLSTLAATLAVPLRDYQPLLVYARGQGSLARGDWAGAAAHFDSLGAPGPQIAIAGVPLALPQLRRDAPSVTPEPLGKTALCIGINYSEANPWLPPLRYAEADAAAMTELLSARGFAVTTLLGVQATGTTIPQALAAVTQVPAQLCVVYLAGYGISGEGPAGAGQAFFAPADLDQTNRGRLQPLSSLILSLAQRVRARNLFVLVDCAYSDLTGLGTANLAAYESNVSESAFATLSDPAGRWRQQLTTDIGTAVAATASPTPATGGEYDGPPRVSAVVACGGVVEIREFAELQHGVATYFALDGWRGAAADPTSGQVTDVRLYVHINRNLVERHVPPLARAAQIGEIVLDQVTPGQDAAPGNAPSPAGAGNRALLIGIDAYLDPAVPSQHGCVNDALALREWLITQAGWAPDGIRLLLAPHPDRTLPPDLGPVAAPTGANIRAAFTDLPTDLVPGDQVCVYYAGYSAAARDAALPGGQGTALVPVDAKPDGTGLLSKDEMGVLIGRLAAGGAEVTLLLDTHNRDSGEPGWLANVPSGADVRVLWAAMAGRTSHEFTPPGQTQVRGAFTYCLLDTLRTTPPSAIPALQWRELLSRVQSKLAAFFPDQIPLLEGRTERPVFGGTWRPVLPGLTVTAVDPASGALTLDGGAAQGVNTSTTLAIYPPDTVDFAAADQVGLRPLKALITSFNATQTEAHLAPGYSGPVALGARARILGPAPPPPPLAVALIDVPEPLTAGLREMGTTLLDLRTNTDGAAVAVQARAPIDGQPGWALLRLPAPTPGPDDVIATIPPEMVEQGASPLGAALLHWANYLAIRDYPSTDPTLRGTVALDVLAGRDQGQLLSRWASAEAPVRAPDSSGQVVVGDDERLLLKVTLASDSPGPLQLTVLLCSDDGNIDVLWPPPSAEPVFKPGESHPVGLNGPLNPFQLQIRADQATSRYVFKVFVTDPAQPFDPGALRLQETVQDLIAGTRRPSPPPVAPLVLCMTLAVPVLVRRAARAAYA